MKLMGRQSLPREVDVRSAKPSRALSRRVSDPRGPPAGRKAWTMTGFEGEAYYRIGNLAWHGEVAVDSRTERPWGYIDATSQKFLFGCTRFNAERGANYLKTSAWPSSRTHHQGQWDMSLPSCTRTWSTLQL